MEQLEVSTNPSLQKIFERAATIRQELGGQRYFPTVVAQIASEIGGGYKLTSHERTAVQAGTLATQSKQELTAPVPEQREVPATEPSHLQPLAVEHWASRPSRFYRLQKVLRRTRLLHQA